MVVLGGAPGFFVHGLSRRLGRSRLGALVVGLHMLGAATLSNVSKPAAIASRSTIQPEPMLWNYRRPLTKTTAQLPLMT